VRSGTREDAHENDRDRDRERQEKRDPEEPTGDASNDSGGQNAEDDDQERTEITSDHERADRPDSRERRLCERVEAVIRRRGGRRKGGEEGDVVGREGTDCLWRDVFAALIAGLALDP
jgi:hypothetical protein